MTTEHLHTGVASDPAPTSNFSLRIVAPLATALLLLMIQGALAQPAETTLDRGREYTQQFYAGELEGLVARFSTEFADVIGGEAGLRAFRDGFLADVGEEVEVLSENVTPHPGAEVYQRVVTFEKFGSPVAIVCALDPEGTVLGMFIGPATEPQEAPSAYLDYETRTELRLPFEGEWFVGWGGRSIDENYHAAYPDQRFAYDFLIIRDGSSREVGGTGNEAYYCFGQPILAPGAGTVVTALDGEPDRTPGQLIAEPPLGNHVIIDHENGEYSFLAHLRQGTVAVQAGQRVEAGDLVGECGNSGHSSEPHLHYHLQTTPDFGMGDGLPPQFTRYLADGQAVERGEPVRGQLVRSAE